LAGQILDQAAGDERQYFRTGSVSKREAAAVLPLTNLLKQAHQLNVLVLWSYIAHQIHFPWRVVTDEKESDDHN
jgi:hypothetical protein